MGATMWDGAVRTEHSRLCGHGTGCRASLTGRHQLIGAFACQMVFACYLLQVLGVECSTGSMVLHACASDDGLGCAEVRHALGVQPVRVLSGLVRLD
jgi:hypothetical protein